MAALGEARLGGAGAGARRRMLSSGRPHLAPPAPRALRRPALCRRGARTELRATAYKQDVEEEAALLPREAAAAAPDADADADAPFLPDLWPRLAALHGDAVALSDPHAPQPSSSTFRQLAADVAAFAAGLAALGAAPGDVVGLFAEGSARWLVADQGVQAAGAADAVRGAAAPAAELGWIARHAGAVGLIVQDAAALARLLPELLGGGGGPDGNTTAPHPLRFVVTLWGEPGAAAAAALGCPALAYAEVLELGAAASGASASGSAPPRPRRSGGAALATLVYTSGTTGKPKAVALSHANLAYQVRAFPDLVDVQPGEVGLSLLPPWHIYGRVADYFLLSRGARLAYTAVPRLRDDLAAVRPDYLVCVPLVLEALRARVAAALAAAPPLRRAAAAALLAAATARVRALRVVRGVDLAWARAPAPLWARARAWLVAVLLAPAAALCARLVAGRVRAALGVRRAVVCGGGSLAGHLDDFFEALGLPVLNGYGLTEASPVLACRRLGGAPGGNVRGSVGRPLPGTALRVVDPATQIDVADGEQGLILARGPGVTAGYYGDAAATAAAFAAGGGWLDTGDLGWRAPAGVPGSAMAGVVVLTGRAKDTIVLTSGENVEPQPLEDAVAACPAVQHCVLVGQGRRHLGLLVFPAADARDAPREAVEGDVAAFAASALAGRPRWERVRAVRVVRGPPLSVEDGTLTRTMKPRRAAIVAKYAADVAALEARLG